ncbi:MAG TPA: hypothetical protein VGD95_03330 [Micavibrio sp.]
MKWIENLTGNYSASASVVDGTLIIALPQAITPVVWRMELGHVRASALEVRAQENGVYMLTLKTPKGDVHDIAPFSSRGQAVQALMSVSRAMEQAHGQMRAATMSPTMASTHDAAHMTAANSNSDVAQPALQMPAGKVAAESSKGRFITGVIGTLLLLALIAILLNTGKPSDSVIANSHSPAAGSAATAPTGVPMSADDFLNNR